MVQGIKCRRLVKVAPEVEAPSSLFPISNTIFWSLPDGVGWNAWLSQRFSRHFPSADRTSSISCNFSNFPCTRTGTSSLTDRMFPLQLSRNSSTAFLIPTASRAAHETFHIQSSLWICMSVCRCAVSDFLKLLHKMMDTRPNFNTVPHFHSARMIECTTD